MKKSLLTLVVLISCAALTSIVNIPEVAAEETTTIGSFAGDPTSEELAFMRQWSAFLLQNGDANAERYSADVPFSFMCGERSSLEWLKR